MNTFRFLNFPVYKQSKVFYKAIGKVAERLEKQYALRDQITRASLSVVLNIAEGSAKKSDKDFARFLQISVGSINEVVACLDLAKDLEKITENEYNHLIEKAEEIAKQLGGFIKSLYKKS